MAVDSTAPELRRRYEDRLRVALQAWFRRLAETITANGGFDTDTFRTSLEGVIFSNGKATAEAFGRRVYEALVGRSAGEPAELRFDPDLLDPWIDEVSTNAADALLDATIEGYDEAFADDAVDEYETDLTEVRAGIYAVTMVTTFANFGAHDGARAANGRSKTWRTNSGNPRSSHASLDGETVSLGENFSNGMRWPGDPSGGVDEVAGCQCSMELAA